MLRNDAIYNSSFRFRDIRLNNINDIYFAINIIVIIITTLFKIFIAAFILTFIIVIIIDVNVIVIIIVIVFLIIVSEKSIFKFIAFRFNIKNCLTMSTSFDKS